MKLDFGETAKEKQTRLSQWHKHFAWRPVKLADHDYRWLETVWRKGKLHAGFECDFWRWEYADIRARGEQQFVGANKMEGDA